MDLETVALMFAAPAVRCEVSATNSALEKTLALVLAASVSCEGAELSEVPAADGAEEAQAGLGVAGVDHVLGHSAGSNIECSAPPDSACTEKLMPCQLLFPENQLATMHTFLRMSLSPAMHAFRGRATLERQLRLCFFGCLVLSAHMRGQACTQRVDLVTRKACKSRLCH